MTSSGPHRAVTFRLKPTVRQVQALTRLLKSQCDLYNDALEHRIGAWKWNHESVTMFDQFKLLTDAQVEIPSLVDFGLQPHRGTLKRLDEAFGHFFRRVKVGQTPGFPRFKSKERFDSVSYPTAAGWGLYETNDRGSYGRLRLKGVGHIKVHLRHGSRSAHLRNGTPTKLVVRRRGHGWEVTVFYKDVTPLLAPIQTEVNIGIDRGITVLAAIVGTDGVDELVENPRHLRFAANDLKTKQQALARRQRGSNRRKNAVVRVADAHRRVAGARRYTNHVFSRRLIQDYDTIVLEKLTIRNMTQSAKGTVENPGTNVAQKSGLNKEILNAGWGQLASMIVYKAEEAGRRVVFVNPRHTSQRCHQCGYIDEGNREGIAFKCLRCGRVDHADLNAARNILNLGQESGLRLTA